MATSNLVFTTPAGIAQYPWLSTPDTKFSETGDYKVSLVLTKEAALPIIKQIKDVFMENVESETKKNKGKEIKKANPPFAEELDDEGKATGNIIIRFKSSYKPSMFDSKANPMVDVNVWSGSEIKVNGSIAPYHTALIGAGVSLRLRAVQVITLVEGGQSAGGYGFEEQEGYEYVEAPKLELEPAPEAFIDTQTPEPAAAEIKEPVKRADDKPAAETKKSSEPLPETGEVSLDDLVSEWE